MTYEKLLFSETAITNGISNQPVSMEIIRNLQQLQDVLSSLELLLGVEICINSGYRCPELNALVGGVYNSYHLLGLAADIRVENSGRCTLTDLKNLCKELRKTRLSEVVIHDTYVHIAVKPYYSPY